MPVGCEWRETLKESARPRREVVGIRVIVTGLVTIGAGASGGSGLRCVVRNCIGAASRRTAFHVKHNEVPASRDETAQAKTVA